MKKVFDFFGGRKTTFALMLFVVITALLLLHKCEFSEYTDFIMWIFGIFCVGNAGEHLANGIGNLKK